VLGGGCLRPPSVPADRRTEHDPPTGTASAVRGDPRQDRRALADIRIRACPSTERSWRQIVTRSWIGVWSGNSLGGTLVVAVSRLVKTKNAGGACLHLTLTSVTNTDGTRYAVRGRRHRIRLPAPRRCPDRVHAARLTANRADDVAAAYNDVHCSGSPASGRQDTPWGLQPAFLMSAVSGS
jgi:hypothetical protein